MPQGHVYAGHVPSAKLPAPAPLPRVAPAAQTLLGTAAKTVAYHALVSHAAMLSMQLSPVVEPLSSTPPNSQPAAPARSGNPRTPRGRLQPPSHQLIVSGLPSPAQASPQQVASLLFVSGPQPVASCDHNLPVNLIEFHFTSQESRDAALLAARLATVGQRQLSISSNNIRAAVPLSVRRGAPSTRALLVATQTSVVQAELHHALHTLRRVHTADQDATTPIERKLEQAFATVEAVADAVAVVLAEVASNSKRGSDPTQDAATASPSRAAQPHATRSTEELVLAVRPPPTQAQPPQLLTVRDQQFIDSLASLGHSTPSPAATPPSRSKPTAVQPTCDWIS